MKNCFPYWIPTPYRNSASPSVPTIGAGTDFGANQPIASATKSTAPTPREKPLMLISPTRYPMAMVRNSAIIGCCESRFWIISMRSPLDDCSFLACVATGVAELPDHPREEFGCRRRRVGELIFLPEFLPLERAE